MGLGDTTKSLGSEDMCSPGKPLLHSEPQIHCLSNEDNSLL
jgi:hypothetical protein